LAIRVLAPDVAARIAAGEVVERPASVVKELVENAIDAGASSITLEVESGGINSIRVTDDGCGIEPDELELAFTHHATSKLSDDPDLARISTLGFRGEALPSIASVAEVEMVSRCAGNEAAAYVKLTSGQPPKRGSRGAPPGTGVLVRGLFASQPARRKFLRTPAGETNALVNVVNHIALAYPEVRFSLSVDGRQALTTSGGGDLRDAAAAVYSARIAGAMLSVRPLDGPIGVEGLTSPPDVSRANRSYISLFVNRRWVQSRRLTYAVEEAYQGMLMVGRRPIAVLNIALPYEEVDVNVHPAKAEVRFRDESAVFAALQRSVRQALTAAAPVPTSTATPAAQTGGLLAPQPTTPPLWEHAVSVQARPPVSSGAAVRPELAGQPLTATPAQTLPVLRVIGQFGSVYIVAEGPEGMYLIDQHGAHERVCYERFCRQREKREPEVQGLLEPLTLELSSRQAALLSEDAEALRGHGFDIEPFGEGAFLLRAVPQSLSARDVRQAVHEFLDLMLEEGEGDRRDRVAMSLACHGAVRAGKTLSTEEMRDLMGQLEACETPNTCPHGRPTMIHMSAEALAHEFGRR
jgi:DNA mismatch repair protein MutL